MEKSKRFLMRFLPAMAWLLMITLPEASGQTGGGYDLTLNAIDGGGVIVSTGGSYSLSGTIGQPDVSTALSGGDYSLAGGFWAGVPYTNVTSWDTDADGKGDVAVWRPDGGVWYTLLSGSPGSFTGAQWGISTDRPVPGDYSGDGKSDIAVWRPSLGTWFILPSNSPGEYIATQWGVSSDITAAADYDGDERTDIAVWRPGTGT